MGSDQSPVSPSKNFDDYQDKLNKNNNNPLIDKRGTQNFHNSFELGKDELFKERQVNSYDEEYAYEEQLSYTIPSHFQATSTEVLRNYAYSIVNEAVEAAISSQMLSLNEAKECEEPVCDEDSDSDDSYIYIRRRVAELNAQLAAERDIDYLHAEKQNRVTFIPQLVHSSTTYANLDESSEISQNLDAADQEHHNVTDESDLKTEVHHFETKTEPFPDDPVEPQGSDHGEHKVPTQQPEKPKLRCKSATVRSPRIESAKPRQSDNQNAIKAWMRRKNQQEREKRQKEMEMQQKMEEERRLKEIKDREIREKQFNAWLQGKMAQAREEKELKRREQEEKRSYQVVHTREACQDAFQKWLKKKNHEVQQRLDYAKERARISRQIWAKQHKTPKLMQLIHHMNMNQLLKLRER